jgi:hypothetical protein
MSLADCRNMDAEEAHGRYNMCSSSMDGRIGYKCKAISSQMLNPISSYIKAAELVPSLSIFDQSQYLSDCNQPTLAMQFLVVLSAILLASG